MSHSVELDLDALLTAALRAARAGGEIVSDRFGAPQDVRAKAAGDYVSEADTSSEDTVRALLAGDAPGISFFGEETGGVMGERGWVVDPLDGTANFLHGFPLVGVSVALLDLGRPVLGVVHAPLLDDTFFAVKGGGAFRITAGSDPMPITISTRVPQSAICATGFPFRLKNRAPRYLEMFGACFGEFEDLRRAGAASLDLALTAAAVFDGFFELGLGPWDVAAGAVIIREAGGVVTDWDGHPDEWLHTGDILAGPPQVHEQLLKLAAVSRKLNSA